MPNFAPNRNFHTGHKVEIIRFEKIGEVYYCESACDGQKVMPFEFHAAQYHEVIERDGSIEPFLRRKSVEYLELFGDIRNGVPEVPDNSPMEVSYGPSA